MGLITSYVFRPSEEVVQVDPATGLTTRQKRIVRDSWAILQKNSIASGVAIMTSYFKEYPEHQKAFPLFRDKPLEELANSKKFQAHCQSIMSTLSNALDALDDVELMDATLQLTGERHGKRGQRKQQFLDLKKVIMTVLESVFGAKFTPEFATAWDKTIDLLFSKIFLGMENSNS
ncbi:globin isoform X1 [Prorops nasuta]|uniref:globin isoform X1 n=1 Tax=Prorops nasuta TaxID=863751 RepID=UPI0034CE5AD5